MKKGVRILISSMLAVSLAAPAWLSAAELPVGGEGETITLMVELRRPTSLEEMRGAREVRKLSNRAPREYIANGEVRLTSDLRNWRAIEVAVSEVVALKEKLAQNPAVLSVREEYTYEAAVMPNDPRFGEQIGLHIDAWPLDINAPEAWERTTGSGNTVVAIVDGGVDADHEDLRDKIVPGQDFVQEGCTASDHGTHVAGIAAASGNN
ncbi:MAG: S8 family serine peptidase, partial [Patescibacteria group bacterium]